MQEQQKPAAAKAEVKREGGGGGGAGASEDDVPLAVLAKKFATATTPKLSTPDSVKHEPQPVTPEAGKRTTPSSTPSKTPPAGKSSEKPSKRPPEATSPAKRAGVSE